MCVCVQRAFLRCLEPASLWSMHSRRSFSPSPSSFSLGRFGMPLGTYGHKQAPLAPRIKRATGWRRSKSARAPLETVRIISYARPKTDQVGSLTRERGGPNLNLYDRWHRLDFSHFYLSHRYWLGSGLWPSRLIKNRSCHFAKFETDYFRQQSLFIIHW